MLLALAIGAAEPAASGELTIAAASDLNFVFKELVAGFQATTGTRVKLTFGSSGNFFSQIQNGAPFDLYFSADVRYPQKLIEARQARAETLYTYAIGRIVVWAPKNSPVKVKERGMEALRDPSVRKIAIANPKHAPYGRAAEAAMQQFRIYEQVKDKLVWGENVSQAAQFVASGAADIGIVALSLAMAPSMQAAGTFWEVPASAHQPIEQGAVVLAGAGNPAAAQAFLDYLKAPEARAIMERYGFVLPR